MTRALAVPEAELHLIAAAEGLRAVQEYLELLDGVEASVELLAEAAQKKGLQLSGFTNPIVPTYLRGDGAFLESLPRGFRRCSRSVGALAGMTDCDNCGRPRRPGCT